MISAFFLRTRASTGPPVLASKYSSSSIASFAFVGTRGRCGRRFVLTPAGFVAIATSHTSTGLWQCHLVAQLLEEPSWSSGIVLTRAIRCRGEGRPSVRRPSVRRGGVRLTLSLCDEGARVQGLWGVIPDLDGLHVRIQAGGAVGGGSWIATWIATVAARAWGGEGGVAVFVWAGGGKGHSMCTRALSGVGRGRTSRKTSAGTGRGLRCPRPGILRKSC